MLPVCLLSEIALFKPKMTSADYNLYLQQGARNYKDSEESDLSQQNEDSQNSQETNGPFAIRGHETSFL